MPVVNPLARELVFKVVYYGPGLGGKTTSLQHIHATTRAEHRGKMVSLATPVDRTLYFDFLPIRVPTSRDLSVRLQLFTVPGQVYYNATRKLVLTGADGVVFVVDSQRARADANIESLRNLEENLVEHGHALDEIPHVFSYNKRDLPGIIPIDDLERLFNPRGAPSFATVATSGEGVYETLEAITRAVLEDFEHRMPEHRGLAPSALMLPEGGLAEALRAAEEPGAQAAATNSKATVRERSVPEFGLSLPPTDDIGERAARVFTESGARDAEGDADAPIELLRTKRAHHAMSGGELASPMLSIGGADDGDEAIESPLVAMSHVVATLATGSARATPEDGHFGSAMHAESRFDTRTMISDKAPLPAVSAVPPRSDVLQEAAAAQERQLPGFSLRGLWPVDEHSTVARLEEALVAGDHRDAVLLAAVLVDRSLEEIAQQLGDPKFEACTLMSLIGIPGHAILEFRQLCEASHSTANPLSEQDAIAALLYAANLRRAMRHVRR